MSATTRASTLPKALQRCSAGDGGGVGEDRRARDGSSRLLERITGTHRRGLRQGYVKVEAMTSRQSRVNGTLQVDDDLVAELEKLGKAPNSS